MDKFLDFLSFDFDTNQYIPKRSTCDGKDISPALRWEAVPKHTKSFALIVDDIDEIGIPPESCQINNWKEGQVFEATKAWEPRAFVHWLIYNIPAHQNHLEPGIPKKLELFDGIKQGYNDFCEIGYTGPCPLGSDTHHYRFVLFALDKILDLPTGVRVDQLNEAMTGNIIDQVELLGLYAKQKI